MKRRADISGSVLPVVIVVSVIMALLILGLLSLWDINYLYFSRHNYIRKQREHIESFYTLYCSYPEVAREIAPDSTFLLYAEIPESRVKVRIEPWGLYDAVCVSSLCGKVKSVRLMGLEAGRLHENTLWYRDLGSSLTLTGKTEVTGGAAVTSSGIIYGQIQSVFFSGTELPTALITVSGDELPAGDDILLSLIEGLFGREPDERITDGHSVRSGFHDGNTVCVEFADSVMSGYSIEGKVVVQVDRVRIDSTCRINNALITGNYIEVEEGVKGVLQIFARDSVTVGRGVVMDFPSGVYSEGKITLGEESVINGYVINNFGGEKDMMNANTVKARSSKIRGLYYSRGVSQIQGIITGAAFIDEAVYYTPEGYYRNLIYDAAFIDHAQVPYPLWLGREGKRRPAAWTD